MRTIILVSAIISGVLLFSTTVCGLWIRTQEVVDPSSVTFHMTIALVTVLVTAAAVIMSTVMVFRMA